MKFSCLSHTVLPSYIRVHFCIYYSDSNIARIVSCILNYTEVTGLQVIVNIYRMTECIWFKWILSRHKTYGKSYVHLFFHKL